MMNEELEKYGIDYKDGIERCLNNESLYIQIMQMFLDDNAFTTAKKAFENEDYKLMFASMHELKGVCGNAGLKKLYKSVSEIVELLRKENPIKAEIALQIENVQEAYDLVCSGIQMILKNEFKSL